MNRDIVKGKAHKLGTSILCKRWWKKNKIKLFIRWMRMGFGYKERKILQDGLSDLHPYYYSWQTAPSIDVQHEYQYIWLKRGNEHPDTAYWM